MRRLTMKRITLVLIMISTSLFWSCVDPVQTEPNILKYENFSTLDDQSSNVILPLEIGNLWLYDRITIADNGNQIQTIDTIYVEDEIIIDDELAFTLKTTFNLFCVGPYSNKTNGLWQNHDPLNLPPSLEAKFPGQKGQTYTYTGEKLPALIVDTGGGYKTVYSIREHHYEILSTNTVININGNDYKTYLYELTFNIYYEGQSKEYSDISLKVYPKILKYYCPNIGIIKLEYYERKNGESEFKLKYYSILREYTLN